MIKHTNSRVGINNTGKGIGGKAFIGSCQSPGKEPVYLTFIMFNYCFVSTTHIVAEIFSVMTNLSYSLALSYLYSRAAIPSILFGYIFLYYCFLY